LDRFGDGDGLRDDRGAVAVLLAFHSEFDGEEMLALQSACFVIRARTMRGLWIRRDGVAAVSRL
jgi:hypothetical protein